MSVPSMKSSLSRFPMLPRATKPYPTVSPPDTDVPTVTVPVQICRPPARLGAAQTAPAVVALAATEYAPAPAELIAAPGNGRWSVREARMRIRGAGRAGGGLQVVIAGAAVGRDLDLVAVDGRAAGHTRRIPAQVDLRSARRRRVQARRRAGNGDGDRCVVRHGLRAGEPVRVVARDVPDRIASGV